MEVKLMMKVWEVFGGTEENAKGRVGCLQLKMGCGSVELGGHLKGFGGEIVVARVIFSRDKESGKINLRLA